MSTYEEYKDNNYLADDLEYQLRFYTGGDKHNVRLKLE